MNRSMLPVALLATAALVACAPKDADTATDAAESAAPAAEPAVEVAPAYQATVFEVGMPTTTESGLKVIERQIGTGSMAVPGNDVTVHYTGWLLDEAEP
ncbi:MAG: hypothetical protein AAFU65_12480, partial [Pseudomonadota bacterium]